MALIHRMKTGEGSWVGTSLLGNGLWSCGVIAQAALANAYLPHRPPPRPAALLALWATSTERRTIAGCSSPSSARTRCGRRLPPIIDQPQLVKDPRFAEITERRKNSADTAAIMSKAFASNTYTYWLKALSAGGITFGVISQAAEDVPHDEQAVACGAVVETAIPDLPRTLSKPDPSRLRRAACTAHAAPSSASTARRSCARSDFRGARDHRSEIDRRRQMRSAAAIRFAGARHRHLHRRPAAAVAQPTAAPT